MTEPLDIWAKRLADYEARGIGRRDRIVNLACNLIARLGTMQWREIRGEACARGYRQLDEAKMQLRRAA